MNLRVFFIYICKTAHFGWLRADETLAAGCHVLSRHKKNTLKLINELQRTTYV